jgi:folate-binding protein YgfZ
MLRASSLRGYAEARARAAFCERTDRGWLLAEGADRRSFLHGLLTNDIAALQAGHGCYAALLTQQGRMIADLWVYELGDSVLISLNRTSKDAMLARLNRLVFSEDVQLRDATASYAALAIIGPEAASIAAVTLAGVDAEALALLPDHGNVHATSGGRPAVVLRSGDLGEPGLDILVEPLQFAMIVDTLREHGVQELEPAAAETLRIEGGIPKFHCDMDEATIPLEAGIESSALSFTKGCYVGQEVIVRVLHRGHGRVARRLVGLSLEQGAAPEPKTRIVHGEEEIGHVTSAADSPSLGHPIALGYVRRELTEPGTHLTIDGRQAVVASLPFVPPSYGARKAAQ